MASNFINTGANVIQGDGDPANGDGICTNLALFPVGAVYINSQTGKLFVRNTADGVAADWVSQSSGGEASYLVYTALLSQSGTDAPVATELQNTLGGEVVWTRTGVGLYVGTLAGAFPIGACICNNIGSSANNNSVVMPVTDFSGIVGYIEFSPNGDSLIVNTYNQAFSLTEMNTVIGGTSPQIVVDVKSTPA